MDADEKDKTGLLVGSDVHKKLDIKFGVTCEGCHGPSGDKGKEFPGWNSPHQKSDPWRFMAPEEKRKEFGFWDVRSPASRAKICASCHIGSVEHGRVVTHEMYAAGHPPLPGFEVETFITQMPAHWAKFKDKAPKAVEVFLKNTRDPIYAGGNYKKDDLQQTRSLLVGALVSAAEYYNLLGDLADDKAASPLVKPDWPELATFDCYACHHELKSPAWRQARKPPVGVPGRPFLQEWNTALLKLALERIPGAGPEYEVKSAAVRDALAKQPFGAAADIKKNAREVGAWLWSLALKLERQPIAPDAGPGILAHLADHASAGILDYDSARKFIWASKVVGAEVKSPAAGSIDDILNPLAKDMFLLNLREGRKASATVPGEKMARPIMEVDLDLVLRPIANYNPTRFQEAFWDIKKLLK
jgi:hypothetical protein